RAWREPENFLTGRRWHADRWKDCWKPPPHAKHVCRNLEQEAAVLSFRPSRPPARASDRASLLEPAPIDAELPDLVIHDPPGRAQQPRGLGPVAARRLQRILDEIFFVGGNRVT